MTTAHIFKHNIYPFFYFLTTYSAKQPLKDIFYATQALLISYLLENMWNNAIKAGVWDFFLR